VRTVALAVIFVMAARARAQDVPPICEIRGRATLAHVHVTPGRSTEDVRIDDRQVAITPLAHGLFHVRTLDEGRAIDGTSSDAIEIVIARRVVVGPASIAAGARVADVVIDAAGARGDVTMDAGVRLSRVSLACDALTIGASAPSAETHGEAPHGPIWMARASRLDVRTRPEPDGVRVELRFDDRRASRFFEQERVRGWARIEAHFASGVIAGWVRDTDLALP